MKLTKEQEIEYQKNQKIDTLLPYDSVVFGMGNNLFDYCDEITYPSRYLDNLTLIHRGLRHSLFKGSRGEKNVLYSTTLPGAPAASTVFEWYLAHGSAECGVGVGFTGATQSDIEVGDIILPTEAKIGEGVSRYYFPEDESIPPVLKKGYTAKASPEIFNLLVDMAKKEKINVKKGPIYTTDSFCMETREFIDNLTDEGVLGLDMETSSLFSVADYHKKKAAAIMVVSDNQCSNHTHSTCNMVNGISSTTRQLQKAIEIATKALLDY